MYEKSFHFLSSVAGFALAAAFAFTLAGCQPSIGDKCVLNTDCSSSGTRQCDNSMPGGYCTIFNCGPNTCPDHSACYLFDPAVQGCPYDDRDPSRTAHSFCLEDCSHDSDCRAEYICRDLRHAPWNAILLDDNQSQGVCIPSPDQAYWDAGTQNDNEAVPVCQADPDIDAAFPLPSAQDAGTQPIDAGSDAALLDAGSDTGTKTVDGGGDAGLDAAMPNDAEADASDASDVSAVDATSD
jgi:hypothetical protein